MGPTADCRLPTGHCLLTFLRTFSPSFHCMRLNNFHIRYLFFRMMLGCLCLVSIHSNSYSQNLVPNPSFETFSMCPAGAGPVGPMVCTPWISIQTADYY